MSMKSQTMQMGNIANITDDCWNDIVKYNTTMY